MKALFLDLDHTLIRPLEGRTFPKDKYDWEFLPTMCERITPYVRDNYKIVIVSNQGGIEAGHHTTADIKSKIEFVAGDLIWNVGNIGGMNYELRRHQIAYYFCPSIAKDHPMRKPNPGMVFKAQADHGLDLSASLFIGDMDSDKAAAEAAGVPYMDINDFLALPLPG